MAEKDFHSDQDILLIDGGDRFVVDRCVVLVYERDGHNNAVSLYHQRSLPVSFNGSEPPEDFVVDGDPDEILRKPMKAGPAMQRRVVRIGSKHGLTITGKEGSEISAKVYSTEPQLEVVPYPRKPGQHPAALLRRAIAGGLVSR